MRTTLDIPEELLSQALKLTGCKTRTKVITLALHNLVQKEKLSGLKKYRGKF